MRVSVLSAPVLGAALLIAASADAATDPEATATAPKQTTAKTREQPWIAQCTSESRKAALNCTVNKRIVLAKTGQLVAAVTVRVPSKTREPQMMLQAPLGLHLPPGLSLVVGKGKPVTVPLQTCDNNGCYAGQSMSAELLEKFRSSEKMVLSFQNMSRQDIKITVSLEGFAEAYEKAK